MKMRMYWSWLGFFWLIELALAAFFGTFSYYALVYRHDGAVCLTLLGPPALLALILVRRRELGEQWRAARSVFGNTVFNRKR